MRKRKTGFLSRVKNTLFILVLTSIMLVWAEGYTSVNGLKFVQLSDTHFLQDGANTTFKMIAEGPKLLDDAIEQVNALSNVDFVMFTGDLIDKPFEKELHAVLPHLEKINVPWYFAFGNHDPMIGGYLSKSLYLSILRENNANFKFDKPYYSFKPKKGYKVIVLDSIIDTELTSQGYIYPQELEWFKSELENSKKDIVLIFMHIPIVEPFNSPNHRLRNAEEVKTLIESYKNPIAVFTGHYHAAKIIQHENVLYVDSPALISYPNAFRVITINERGNKVIFNMEFKETRLKNIQKLAKMLVFASTLYTGEEQDREGSFVIKR